MHPPVDVKGGNGRDSEVRQQCERAVVEDALRGLCPNANSSMSHVSLSEQVDTAVTVSRHLKEGLSRLATSLR